jgi:HD-GYP domain-containing protein (c-di-GMP phosphodiesterase class II)
MPVIIIKSGHSKGQVHELRDAIITIGREGGQTIRILDEGVSRQHAEIFRIGEMCFVRDLNSTNGTYVNGQRITEEMLRNGDEITVGNTSMVFEDKSVSTVIREMPDIKFEETTEDSKITTTVELPLGSTLLVRPEKAPKITKEPREIESRNLTLIYEIGNLISTEKDHQRMLERAIDSIVTALQANDGYLFLIEPGTEKLTPRVVIQRDGGGAERRLSRTIAKRVLETRRAVMTSDATLDNRFSLSESVILRKIRSVICVPIVSAGRVEGFLYFHSSRAGEGFTTEDLELATAAGLQLSMAITNASINLRLQEGLTSTIRALVTAIELVDPLSQGHSERVADYSVAVATQMNLSAYEIQDIRLGALLHDVGKIAVYQKVKTQQERERVKEQHVYMGEKLLSSIKGLERILPAIRYHHERADGSGYPYRIKNQQTPVMARIIIVTNAFDNMCTAESPMGKTTPVKDVLLEMGKKGGTEFDDDVIKALLITHRNGTLYNPPSILV